MTNKRPFTGDPLKRWKVGNQLFFPLIQLAVIGLERLEEHSSETTK